MAEYLRVQDGIAVELFAEPEGYTLTECFVPAVAETFHPRGAADVGWLWNGSAFVAPATPATSKADLIAYANAKQWALATGGYTVTVDSLARTFATDPTSQALMTGKVARLSQADPPTEINWQFGSDTIVQVSAASFTTAAVHVADFVQATFDALGPILAAISSGTITTTAEIDAATWPPNA